MEFWLIFQSSYRTISNDVDAESSIHMDIQKIKTSRLLQNLERTERKMNDKHKDYVTDARNDKGEEKRKHEVGVACS
jgi:hypothetical protein